MRKFVYVLFFVVLPMVYTNNISAQTNPSSEELHKFFNNEQLLITYREGEALYGTYYFLEIHYCSSGYYGLYGSTVKRTVLGNEQKSNWQEYGTWKITSQNGVNGIFCASTTGNQMFYPIYKLANGSMYISEGVSIVKKGRAICNN
ncbi:hypothetical protein [Seonamhaeicola sp. ML3]|uniref:hypothetical protein n=1 Tax=Seonamhaeicola sp. ML3 TaxID=2937786 RepID=UPI00200EEBC5|nr:hypothetical protein [Seonamhaeicola sp. ML3]